MVKKKYNKVRIIAGRLRGRNITFPDSPGLRPTGDRLRETLFSWLQPYIVESRVLDLFAGSGALGFEAISRGAQHVTMVEKSRRVCEVLRQNAAQLEVKHVSITGTDALEFIRNVPVTTAAEDTSVSNSFDIVFIDPPFGEQLHQAVVDTISKSSVLTKNSLLVIENDRRAQKLTVPASWMLEREKTAGEVRLQLYVVQ